MAGEGQGADLMLHTRRRLPAGHPACQCFGHRSSDASRTNSEMNDARARIEHSFTQQGLAIFPTTENATYMSGKTTQNHTITCGAAP